MKELILEIMEELEDIIMENTLRKSEEERPLFFICQNANGEYETIRSRELSESEECEMCC